jgi:hypothetical protein
MIYITEGVAFMLMQINSGSQAGSIDINEKALPPSHERAPLPIKSILIAVIIVAIIVVGGVVLIFAPRAPVGTSTSFTTTKPGQNSSHVTVLGLGGCTNITSPGTYTVNFNLKDSASRGACIAIQSNNVKLACGGNRIIGSGPFDALPPFSYGVEIEKANNVSVLDCAVSNFSYGIAAFGSSGVSVLKSNASSNYMSDVYFNATSNSSVKNSYLTRSLSWEGALYIANGSATDTIQNNTVSYSQVYGINVSSDGESFIQNNVNFTSSFAFFCSAANSYPGSSTASGNNCYNNFGCAFLKCSGANLPANISKITLSNGVYGCGSITRPGTYSLEQDIDMGDYLNVSNPAALNQSLPCIAVRADNVTLNCNGHNIYNSTYPIGIYDSIGVGIYNCNLRNAKGYGIVMRSTSNSSVVNVTVTNAKLGGILIQDSYFNNVTATKLTGGDYGIIINNSQSDNLLNVNASKNGYGVYVIGSSIGNNFYKVTSLNNTDLDVYSATNISSAQTEYVSGMNCGTTNAHWAPCKTYVVANLGYIPVTGCQAVSMPGTYILQSNIIGAHDNCLQITASNVVFNCAGRTIQGNRQVSTGFAASLQNVRDVLIANCTFQNFAGGVSILGSKNVSISNDSIWNTNMAISLNATSGSLVKYDYINTSILYGVKLLGVTNTSVAFNRFSYGPDGPAIVVNNSGRNVFDNNSFSQYQYGMSFSGASTNSVVTNNTATLSSSADYICYGNNIGLAAEIGGNNYGVTEVNCNWMALLQKISPNAPCAALTNPDVFSLTSDYVYPYGTVCFSLLSNYSTINCNGHTVIATNGGVFAQVAKGAHGSIIENCYLKGFTTAIVASNGSAEIYNNTILNSGNSTGISVTGFNDGSILQNNVTGGGIAFAAYNTVSAAIKGNLAYLSKIGYYVNNGTAIEMSGDYAAPNTGIGVLLSNTAIGQFQSLTLNSNPTGIECTGTSKKAGTLIDMGGSVCSSQLNCTWMTQSSSC